MVSWMWGLDETIAACFPTSFKGSDLQRRDPPWSCAGAAASQQPRHHCTSWKDKYPVTQSRIFYVLLSAGQKGPRLASHFSRISGLNMWNNSKLTPSESVKNLCGSISRCEEGIFTSTRGKNIPGSTKGKQHVLFCICFYKRLALAWCHLPVLKSLLNPQNHNVEWA